mmetsp:Transcript_25631/g.59907  ORF Transcript_25631/g.59907 Transcript_25631/m.59907 type:complete len:258 (-) Transcript_25631:288-1061(-)
MPRPPDDEAVFDGSLFLDAAELDVLHGHRRGGWSTHQYAIKTTDVLVPGFGELKGDIVMIPCPGRGIPVEIDIVNVQILLSGNARCHQFDIRTGQMTPNLEPAGLLDGPAIVSALLHPTAGVDVGHLDVELHPEVEIVRGRIVHEAGKRGGGDVLDRALVPLVPVRVGHHEASVAGVGRYGEVEIGIHVGFLVLGPVGGAEGEVAVGDHVGVAVGWDGGVGIIKLPLDDTGRGGRVVQAAHLAELGSAAATKAELGK